VKYIEYNNDKISKLAIGTVQFGLDYGISNVTGKPPQKIVNEIINYIYSKGINCIDTAQDYGNSEEVVGIATKKLNNNYIISKMKSDVFESRLMDSLNDSFKRLKVNKIFSLMLHDCKLLYNWNLEKTKKVENLKKKNLINHFGMSIYSSQDFELALENDSIDVIQIPYNLFDQRALNNNWFHKAKEKNKLIFIRSIYLQGLLLMQCNDAEKRVPGVMKYIKKLDFFCEKLKVTRNELALTFVYSTCNESVILFGCETLNQAKDNINTFENIKLIDKRILSDFNSYFKNIDEKIYNPVNWEY